MHITHVIGVALAICTADKPSPPGWVADLPFTYWHSGGVPLIAMTLNGRGPFLMMFDTGAMITIIDRKVYEAVGGAPLVIDDRSTISMSGELTRTHKGSLTLEGGGQRWEAQSVKVHPLAVMTRRQGVEGGTVGLNIWNRLVVEIDYEGERIRLFHPEQFVPPDGASTLRLEPRPDGMTSASPGLFVKGQIAGQEGTFILDSGSAGSHVTHDFAERANLSSQPPYFSASISGSDGGRVNLPFYKTTLLLTLGSTSIRPHLFSLNRSFTGEDGLLGWSVLQGFRIFFDLSHRRLYLIRRPQFDVTRTSFAMQMEGMHETQTTAEGHEERALEWYRKALEVHPKNPNLFPGIVRILSKLHRDREALDMINTYLQWYPDDQAMRERRERIQQRLSPASPKLNR